LAKKTGNKKSKPDEKEKSKSMGKRFRLIIPVIVVICIIGVVWFVINPEVAKAESKAQLVIDSGIVQIKHTGGSWISAENGMLLYESDSVKTGDNSSASIILFESSIVRLDSNTEITLREVIEEEETSVTMEQDAGRTWNTISKMSGIDNYEVQTPTTVASVRGTSFDVYILANGNITISVGNGTVNVTVYENGEIVHSIEVPETLSVTIDPYNIGEPPESYPYEEDDWILENIQKDEELMDDLKAELLNRIEPFLEEVRELFGGPNDEELEALVEGYILGVWSLPDDTPDWARSLFEFS